VIVWGPVIDGAEPPGTVGAGVTVSCGAPAESDKTTVGEVVIGCDGPGATEGAMVTVTGPTRVVGPLG
jgi:hypothetical protein